ncbi:MAG: hypothetical protein ACFHXK_14115 [bacterium]
MSSARSITAAVNPPRAVYLDYPLGHTAGKRHDANNQLAIMRDTLAVFEHDLEPGSIVDLSYYWGDDDSWKDSVMRPEPALDGKNETHNDTRTERFDTPQYQHEKDRRAADPHCPSCVFLEETTARP